MRERDPNWLKFERRLIIVFIISFVAFFAISIEIGGDALNGHITDGVHYVSQAGKDTAVHPLVWYYSAVHASITIGSFVLLFGYKIVSGLVRRRPSNSP